MLLIAAGVPAQQESDLIIAVKARILEEIPDFFIWDTSAGVRAGCDNLAALNQTVKSAIALWIRQNVFSRLQVYGEFDSVSEDTRHPGLDKATFRLVTLEQFFAIRRVLEEFEDFAILADVLSILSEGVQGSVMTAVTDTVNQYFDVFNAIGATDDIFRKLHRLVENPRGPEVIEKASLESLIDLGCRLSNTTEEVQKLRTDISALMPGLSAAAFSPISDNMVDVVQSTEPMFADELDHVLAGGTSMDMQTLTRVFSTIIGHLETSFEDSSQSGIRFSQLLARLRRFGPKTFDALLKDWLQKWLHSDLCPNPGPILSTMVCCKVISLKAVIDSAAHLLGHEDHENQRARLALDMLDVFRMASSNPMYIVNYRNYRLLDQLRRLVRMSSPSIIALLKVVVETCRATEAPLRTRARARLEDLSVRNLIQTLVLQQPCSPRAVATILPNTDLQKAFWELLEHDRKENSPRLDGSSRISSLLNSTSDFNVPLVQMKLEAILSDTEILGSAAETLSEILVERARVSRDGRVGLWAWLVSKISRTEAASIRGRAESEIIGLCTTDTTSKRHRDKTCLDGLTALIEAAGFSVSDAEASPILDEIADRLSMICSSPQLDRRQYHGDESDSDHVCLSINVLVFLLIIHQSTIQHSRYSQSALCHVLMSLSRLLIHPFLALHPTLPSYLFDTLALLSDTLSEDSRTRCIHTLRDHHHSQDPRLRFIFGYTEIVNSEWLQLVTKSSTSAETRSEGVTMQPYSLRRWEMMQDATPVSTENDTSLSLTLFGARKSVL